MTDPDWADDASVRAAFEKFCTEAAGKRFTNAYYMAFAAAYREAYKEGWHQGWRDAPSDDF